MIKLALPFFLLFLNDSFACHFLPENNLTIPLGQKNSGLSEEQYNQVIDKFVLRYEKILNDINKTLTIRRLWEDPRVNASTTKKGQEVIINLYGGFARHPEVTPDGYSLVLCHELGHHLGGLPKKTQEGSTWASTEGQADYYATLKCLRKVFRDDDNISAIQEMEIPTSVKDQCSDFKREWERALCIRTTMAGLAVARVMAQTQRQPLPQFEKPDQEIVAKTSEEHPKVQCRLDTYFQGSVCEISSYIPVSGKDEWSGACHEKNGHGPGIRPSCWFASSDPNNSNEISN